MRVYFQKLDNGDWICYDETNSTGDLWVEPAKIHLVTDQLRLHANWGVGKGFRLEQDVTISGFSPSSNLDFELYVNADGQIIHLAMVDINDNDMAVYDRSFALDLKELPSFEPYPYPAE